MQIGFGVHDKGNEQSCGPEASLSFCVSHWEHFSARGGRSGGGGGWISPLKCLAPEAGSASWKEPVLGWLRALIPPAISLQLTEEPALVGPLACTATSGTADLPTRASSLPLGAGTGSWGPSLESNNNISICIASHVHFSGEFCISGRPSLLLTHYKFSGDDSIDKNGNGKIWKYIWTII